jgi:biopolymer transport protein ExbD
MRRKEGEWVMNIIKHSEETKLAHQVAPLIDVVFLLLIYFMVTSSLIRKEGDIAFQLPGQTLAFANHFPVDAYIQIDASGGVSIAGMQFNVSDAGLEALAQHLASLKQMAEMQQSPFLVTLDPDDATLHGRVVDVLDACSAARIKNLTFARKET